MLWSVGSLSALILTLSALGIGEMWWIHVRLTTVLVPDERKSHTSKVKIQDIQISNQGFFCECIWVKPSCKILITTKEALLRFAVFSFSGQTHFEWECLGQISDSIKITVFKTLSRLDTTWNFARTITRLSTHKHGQNHCLRTQSLLKRKFWYQCVPMNVVICSTLSRGGGQRSVPATEQQPQTW